MNVPDLFYEDYLAALRDDVQALGGAKAIGSLMWPEKDVLAARNRLNDSLNPEKRDRLTHEQEQFIIRKAREMRGFSAALYCWCDETGFKRPEPVNPQDEQAQLQREFIDSVRRQELVARRLEALTQPAIRAVKA